ncbi:MAG: tetratricopeptide repeat protein [Geobacter sp.]|nr:tetratricopeptide repeat protein [Geobacter sp.]
MQLLIHVAFITALLLPFSAHAEIKTITHTVQQPFGGSQSPDDARTAGIARAKREALERFGTYIESSTVVKNAQVDSDEILALTAGVTKAEVLKQKNYTDGDGFGLEITVKMELDTDVLDKSLKRLLQDRNHLKDLTAARQREKVLLARIAELEKENKKKGKTATQSAKLKKEFQKTRDGLTAVEWFDKAMLLWDGEKFFDPKKTIECITQAIHLNPTDVAFYNNRGLAYFSLKQYRNALSDYSQAIKLEPKNSIIYMNRGATFTELRQYKHAIKDFDQAILISPAYAKLYSNRGGVYSVLNQYRRALADYNRSIQLDPTLAVAYFNRGALYYNLEQYQKAIADFDHAVRLAPVDAMVYYFRGKAHQALKQYQLATENYDQEILLKPDDVDIYQIRGLSHILANNQKAGCRDLQYACQLGECSGLEAVRQDNLCN